METHPCVTIHRRNSRFASKDIDASTRHLRLHKTFYKVSRTRRNTIFEANGSSRPTRVAITTSQFPVCSFADISRASSGGSCRSAAMKAHRSRRCLPVQSESPQSYRSFATRAATVTRNLRAAIADAATHRIGPGSHRPQTQPRTLRRVSGSKHLERLNEFREIEPSFSEHGYHCNDRFMRTTCCTFDNCIHFGICHFREARQCQNLLREVFSDR